MELTMPIVVSGTRMRCGKYKVKTYHYIVAQSKIVHMGYLVRLSWKSRPYIPLLGWVS